MTLDSDWAAQTLSNLLADTQAKPVAIGVELSTMFVSWFVEWCENRVQFFFFHANACILHSDDDVCHISLLIQALFRHLNQNIALPTWKLDGVANQVDKHLLHTILVDKVKVNGWLNFRINLNLFWIGDRFHNFQNGSNCFWKALLQERRHEGLLL